MKLTIDRERCEGHGRCYSLYPGLFHADDDGRGHVQTETLGEDDAKAAHEAVSSCPERAIDVVG
jgi:ferredoxin